MQNSTNMRILELLQFLYERTDENHPATVSDIIAHLNGKGIQAVRQTVYADTNALIDAGIDIVVAKSTQNQYFMGSRLFEYPELKMLTDAVASSKIISAKKSKELVQKLCRLTSTHQAEQLQKFAALSSRVKPHNEKVYYTMAQEESRKISERSLAGQRVSREKGVLYGNGNIFGYTRNKLTKQFEIDPDQAETVKMIFDLYDSGMGETLVAKELTRLGRKNGVGKVKWDAGKVSKIIKRKNYLGYTVYCQSYSNNYLEQKRIKRDESEFVYVKGGFPQIISEEQYERCNAIRRSRTKRLTDEKGRTQSFGIQQAQNVWGRKMRCRCGSPMLRHRWRTNNAGKPIYGYECKRHHDTPRIRLQNEQGNPTPICEIKPVGQNKLELMASKIFERVWGDQREIVLQTCKMLDACYKPDTDRRADLMKAKDDSIQLLQQQLDDLVVVRARGEIEQDKFLQRTIEIQQQMEALRQSKAQIASEDYNPGHLDMEAIEAALCEAVEMHDGLVSEDFIDLFVSQVTPLSDSRFAWCLDFSPQPTVAFLNLAGQRKYTTCSMDSKLHFGPFADEEGHTIPFPGSLRR